jgi:hypothetical protein
MEVTGGYHPDAEANGMESEPVRKKEDGKHYGKKI